MITFVLLNFFFAPLVLSVLMIYIYNNQESFLVIAEIKACVLKQKECLTLIVQEKPWIELQTKTAMFCN